MIIEIVSMTATTTTATSTNTVMVCWLRGRIYPVSTLNLLCKSLISKHLLLLKHFSCESNLHLYNSLFVNDAAFGSAVVHEELLVVYQNSLAFLHVAHEPAVKVGIQVINL